MHKYILFFAIAFACVVSKSAQDIKPAAFSKGDNVCFIGDSITHGGAYVMRITLFYATRFPHDRINFYNVGISGDTVQHVNKRTESDILSLKPDVATLMIGMNNNGIYAVPNMDEKHAKRVDNNRQMYRKNIDEILDKLAAAKCRAIVFTPSIYDETVRSDKKLDRGKNGELRVFGEYVLETSKKRGLSVVDMWGYMMDVNAELQRDFPELSLAGVDRVHPRDLGAYVMMANFVRTMGEHDTVSRVEIDAKSGKVIESFNADVSDIKSGDGLSFSVLEYALPYTINKDEEIAEKIIGFVKNCNKQIVKVANLEKGEYELAIDGKPVGRYTSDELAFGVNLGSNKNTPQYAQSLGVVKIAENYKTLCNSLREINATEMWYDLENLKTDEEKIAKLDLMLKKNKMKHPYIIACGKRYKKQKPLQAETFERTRVLLGKIYDAAKPTKHIYELKRVAD